MLFLTMWSISSASNLSTRLSRFDFETEPLDAALHYGTRDWVGVNYLQLADEIVIPVCAASFLGNAATDPAALTTIPLLHLETRPSAWEEWFLVHGVSASNLSGMLCDQFSILAQARSTEWGSRSCRTISRGPRSSAAALSRPGTLRWPLKDGTI